MASESLRVKISADISGFNDAMKQMSAGLEENKKNLEGLTKFGNNLKAVGAGLTAGLTAPIVAAGVASAKTAMTFEAGMNEVSAISGATGNELQKLSDLAKEMGRTTKFSATESAEALKYMGIPQG